MYLLYASCTYIFDDSSNGEPKATISPTEISWGDDCWYQEGARNGDSFNEKNLNYSIKDMHMSGVSDNGTKYDLIFVDELTAYDLLSETYYRRADYDTLYNDLISGKFVNAQNENDYYVFKDSGKSIEYFGNQVFKGSWSFKTSSILKVYDNTCKEYFEFELIFDVMGNISGFKFYDSVYNLEN